MIRGNKLIQMIGEGQLIRTMLQRFVWEERGEMLGTMGWMAIMATVLVLLHGLITGWLPGFVDSVFKSMESLV